MMTLLTLCLEFMKVGLFTIGGGLAALPFLTQMIETRGWFDAEMLANMVAISESTPGPLGINMATYVGYVVSGIPGAVLASLSVILPSIIIVILLSLVFSRFKENRVVRYVFTALRAAVTGLILSAGVSMLQMSLYKAPAEGTNAAGAFAGIQWIGVGVFVVFLALMHLKPLKKLHPIVFIGLGAVVGVVLQLS